MEIKCIDFSMAERNAGSVGLFFYVDGQLLLHSCPLESAEKYGNFLIYPASHDEIRETDYRKKYLVDYDYFPRGRITFHALTRSFWLYRDTCIPNSVIETLK